VRTPEEGRFAIRTMTGDKVSFTLGSNLDSVNRAEKEAERFASESGFQGDELQEIAMAVREATINAVLHGNGYDPAKSVDITFERKPAALVITVRDQGNGFDAGSVPDPLAPENLLKQSGRGIFLIRTYMDEVRYRNLGPGTEVVLIKCVRGAAADAKEKAE
jgi:serine/threonine-protein kinase RsbW